MDCTILLESTDHKLLDRSCILAQTKYSIVAFKSYGPSTRSGRSMDRSFDFIHTWLEMQQMKSIKQLYLDYQRQVWRVLVYVNDAWWRWLPIGNWGISKGSEGREVLFRTFITISKRTAHNCCWKEYASERTHILKRNRNRAIMKPNYSWGTTNPWHRIWTREPIAEEQHGNSLCIQSCSFPCCNRKHTNASMDENRYLLTAGSLLV